MNLETMLKALGDAHGDRKKLTLATLDLALSAVDPALRRAFETAAIPHWFDVEILRRLLDVQPEQAEATYAALGRMATVEPYPARSGHNVHETARRELRERMATNEPDRFRRLSAAAAGLFSSATPSDRIERAFHMLFAAPQDGREHVRALVDQWKSEGESELLQAFGVALSEAEATTYLPSETRARVMLAILEIKGSAVRIEDRISRARECVARCRNEDDLFGEAEAHNVVGAAHMDAGATDDALDEYRSALALLKNLTSGELPRTEWLRELASTQCNVGDALQEQGALDEALKYFQNSHTVRSRLIQLQPANALWRRDLGVSHNRIGLLFVEAEELTQALEHFETYKSITQQLVIENPENTDWRRELGVAHSNVGDALIRAGRPEEALREFEASLAVAGALLERDPDDPDRRRDLAYAQRSVGDVLRDQGRLTEALARYEQARQLTDQLVSLDENNWNWKRHLAVVSSAIGDVLERNGNWEEAVSHFAKVRDLFQELEVREPDNNKSQRELLAAYQRLGRLHEASGNDDAALSCQEHVAALVDGLLKTQPSDMDLRREKSIAHFRLSGLFKRLGNLTEALKHIDIDRRIATDLAELDPANLSRQYDLALSHSRAAEIHEELDNLSEARAAYEACLEVLNRLLPQQSSDEHFVNAALETLYQLSNVLMKSGQSVESEDAFNRARTLIDAFASSTPDSPAAKRMRAAWHYNRARFLQAVGRRQEALEELEADLAISEDLVRNWPDNEAHQHGLASTRQAIEELLRDPLT